MKLRLVYYFYAPTVEYPLIYDYHFACLKRFSNNFDEALIILAVDNEYDYEYINSLKCKFLNIFDSIKTITFKVYKNNIYYREALAFKQEIIDTLKSSDSLTFFAHSKGYTNVFDENLKYWVCAMYYFNLRDINKIKYTLSAELTIFYSYMVIRGSEVASKYKWHFPGSFYWINCPYLYLEKGDNLPVLSNRWYAEMFPGSIYELSSSSFNKIRKARWAAKYFLEGNYNCYEKFKYLTSLVYSKEDQENLDNFVKSIDKEIELKNK